MIESLEMTKPEITSEQKRMLEALANGLPGLFADMQERAKGIQAVQQKIAAHISMLQAYGWQIPEMPGLTIQQTHLSPEQAQAVFGATLQGNASPAAPLVVQPAAASVPKPERASARVLIRHLLEEGPRTVPELREIIRQKHGQSLAAPTVYRVLAEEAVRAGEGKWKLKI